MLDIMHMQFSSSYPMSSCYATVTAHGKKKNLTTTRVCGIGYVIIGGQ